MLRNGPAGNVRPFSQRVPETSTVVAQAVGSRPESPVAEYATRAERCSPKRRLSGVCRYPSDEAVRIVAADGGLRLLGSRGTYEGWRRSRIRYV